jgi:hypothetical protein
MKFSNIHKNNSSIYKILHNIVYSQVVKYNKPMSSSSMSIDVQHNFWYLFVGKYEDMNNGSPPDLPQPMDNIFLDF